MDIAEALASSAAPAGPTSMAAMIFLTCAPLALWPATYGLGQAAAGVSQSTGKAMEQVIGQVGNTTSKIISHAEEASVNCMSWIKLVAVVGAAAALIILLRSIARICAQWTDTYCGKQSEAPTRRPRSDSRDMAAERGDAAVPVVPARVVPAYVNYTGLTLGRAACWARHLDHAAGRRNEDLNLQAIRIKTPLPDYTAAVFMAEAGDRLWFDLNQNSRTRDRAYVVEISGPADGKAWRRMGMSGERSPYLAQAMVEMDLETGSIMCTCGAQHDRICAHRALVSIAACGAMQRPAVVHRQASNALPAPIPVQALADRARPRPQMPPIPSHDEQAIPRKSRVRYAEGRHGPRGEELTTRGIQPARPAAGLEAAGVVKALAGLMQRPEGGHNGVENGMGAKPMGTVT